MEFDSVMVYILFMGIPAMVLIWFAVSLILTLTAPKNSRKREDFKTMAMISGILAGLLTLTVVGLVIAALIAKNGA